MCDNRMKAARLKELRAEIRALLATRRGAGREANAGFHNAWRRAALILRQALHEGHTLSPSKGEARYAGLRK